VNLGMLVRRFRYTYQVSIIMSGSYQTPRLHCLDSCNRVDGGCGRICIYSCIFQLDIAGEGYIQGSHYLLGTRG